MRITYLQDDFPPLSQGGAGYSTYELAVAMQKRGHEVSVITTCRKESEGGESTYEGMAVFRIVSRYPERFRSYVSLKNSRVTKKVDDILRRLQPDAVHINNIHEHLSYHCFKLAKRHAKKVVFTARDAMSVHYGKLQTKRYLDTLDCRITWLDEIKQARWRFNPFRDVIIRRYLSYADHIVAVSDALRKALVQNGLKRVGVIHTGADTDEWKVEDEETTAFRNRYGLEGKEVVLFGGRLSEGKGGGQVLRAFAKVVEEHKDAVLLVVGTKDAYAGKLLALAQALGVEKKVMTTGWIERNHMRVAYGAADVVIVPSLYLDPFPRIVIEAMASGKPVVGTTYGGAPEIIVEDRTGFIVDPFNVFELAAKIKYLLAKPAEARTFGLRGRERIEESFKIDETIGKYMALYKHEI